MWLELEDPVLSSLMWVLERVSVPDMESWPPLELVTQEWERKSNTLLPPFLFCSLESQIVCRFCLVLLIGNESLTSLFQINSLGFVHFFSCFDFIFHYVLPLLFFFFYIFWLNCYSKIFWTRYLLICSFSFILWIPSQHNINSPSKVWCLLSFSLEFFPNVLWSLLI